MIDNQGVLKQRLKAIQSCIEIWCLDEGVPDQEEFTPSLEAIYNIATGACDKGLSKVEEENDIKRKYYQNRQSK